MAMAQGYESMLEQEERSPGGAIGIVQVAAHQLYSDTYKDYVAYKLVVEEGQSLG